MSSHHSVTHYDILIKAKTMPQPPTSITGNYVFLQENLFFTFNYSNTNEINAESDYRLAIGYNVLSILFFLFQIHVYVCVCAWFVV